MVTTPQDLPPPPRGRPPLLFGAACLAAAMIGLMRALHLRWVCDDSFITFRYVQNFVDGHGLVYNAGERVEGYTHFFWLLLLAFARVLGADPVIVSEVLGLVFFAAAIAVLCLFVLRLYPERPLAPMAALAVALHFDVAVWATGGLETSLFMFLATLSVFLLAFGRPGSRRDAALAGFVLALTVLTRPDGIIFAAAGFGFVIRRERSARLALAFLAPGFLIAAPYAAWKLAYYGDLLPNPYYVKSGGGAYFSQGFRYIGLYLGAYLSSSLILLAVPALLLATRATRRTGESDPPNGDPEIAVLTLAPLFALLYAILFVARVGGDFMFARFIVPVVPITYLAMEVSIRRLLAGRRRVLLPLLLLVPLLLVYEQHRRNAIYRDAYGLPKRTLGPGGVADERWYWTHRDSDRSLLEMYRAFGVALRPYFAGTDAAVLVVGQASLAYYARFPVAIEGVGLTDKEIARLPVTERGRPGHEKHAPREYLVRRGVNFVFMKRPMENDDYRIAYFRVGEETIKAEIITYDRGLMRHLTERFPDEIRFYDFERYLDEYLLAMPGLPRDRVEADYPRFREFYFARNPDPARERRFLEYLGLP